LFALLARRKSLFQQQNSHAKADLSRPAKLAQQVAEFRPGVHVIFMSGYAQSLPEAQIPPGAAFLQKPFRFASLGEQLKLVARKA
jgi:hypothetical protein